MEILSSTSSAADTPRQIALPAEPTLDVRRAAGARGDADEVRQAVAMMGALGSVAELPLSSLLRHQDLRLRTAATEWLGRIGTEASLPALSTAAPEP
jgi:HEAT repeat protein